jgi:CheY-like chemotaxis protein
VDALRILVVDENVDAARSLATILMQMGHQVEVSHDGIAALQAALRLRPSVIFLDLALPGMEGYEVASQLRRDPGSSTLSSLRLRGPATMKPAGELTMPGSIITSSSRWIPDS